MRYMLTLLFFIGIMHVLSPAADIKCQFDPAMNTDQQITSCKLKVIREACEQKGIEVWSNIKVSNSMVDHDRVSTHASCDSMGIKVNNLKISGSSMMLSYDIIKTNETVHTYSRNQYTKGYMDRAINGNVTRIEVDSNSILNLDVNFQVNTHEVKQKWSKVKSITRNLWATLR